MSRTKYTEPKDENNHQESTTGSPKGRNTYGDGVSILGLRIRVQTKSKVRQREYSEGPNAARESGTGNETKLIKLENGKFTGLYKRLCNEKMIRLAYEKIKSKPGNMTAGSDGVTLDGMSEKEISRIVKELREETYKFRPVKRVYISKKNGKMRPLGIPTPRDKMVQEAMRVLLEEIYEPIFTDNSHGFRTGRSCHTALKQTRI